MIVEQTELRKRRASSKGAEGMVVKVRVLEQWAGVLDR